MCNIIPGYVWPMSKDWFNQASPVIKEYKEGHVLAIAVGCRVCQLIYFDMVTELQARRKTRFNCIDLAQIGSVLTNCSRELKRLTTAMNEYWQHWRGYRALEKCLVIFCHL